MAVDLKGRSFVKLLDFEPAEIRYLLDLSEELKAEKYAGTEQQQLRFLDPPSVRIVQKVEADRFFELVGHADNHQVAVHIPGSLNIQAQSRIIRCAKGNEIGS